MSSVVIEARYDPQSSTMTVQFHGGAAYQYRVSPRIWSEYQRAPSKGAYVNRVLRGRHHRRIENWRIDP